MSNVISIQTVAAAAYAFYTGDPRYIALTVLSGYGDYQRGNTKIEGPRLSDLSVGTSQYGQPIPWIFGSTRMSGQVWWSSDKRVLTQTTGGKGGPQPEVTTYSYEVDMIVGLCDVLPGNRIRHVSRIWSNGKLVWTRLSGASDASLAASDASNLWRRMTVYDGSEEQLPDPMYEAAVGVGNAPAFRGRAYIAFEGLQLGASGYVPSLSFEVVASGQYATGDSAAGPTQSIPGIVYAGTAAASTSTTLRISIPQWDAYYGQNDVSVFDIDVLDGSVTQVGSFTVTSPSTENIAVGTSDVPCMMTGSGYTAKMYEVPGGGATDFTLIPNIGFAVMRFGRRGDDVVVGSNDFSGGNPRRLYKYTGGGSPVATSAALAQPVESILILGDMVYAASPIYTAEVYRLDLATLTLQETFAAPTPDNTPILCDLDGDLCYIDSAGCHVWVRRSGTWVDLGAYDSAFAASGSTYASAGVVGGLLVGGVCKSSPKQYATWTAPLIVDQAPQPLQDVVDEICTRAGMPAGSWDSSALSTITRQVRALGVAQVMSGRNVLEQLAMSFFFDAWLGDKLYFQPRQTTPIATIPWQSTGTTIDQPGEPQSPTLAGDLELPPQVAVTYANVSDDQQSGTEYSDRILSGQAAVRQMQWALGMTPAEAKSCADALVADAAAALLSGSISVPLSYAKATPGDVIELADRSGTTYRLRIVRKRDERGVITLEGVGDDEGALESVAITDETQVPTNTVQNYQEALFAVIDPPCLRDQDNSPGYYVVAKGVGVPYAGAYVQRGLTTAEFTTVATVTESAVFGACTTELGDYAGVGFDETNTVTVDVGVGELSSSTRSAILIDSTINAAMIGSEVVQFRTATLISAGLYKLSGLLRGVRGTEWAMSSHSVDETFVLLRDKGMRRVTMQGSDIGRAAYYRAQSIGRADATDEQAYTVSDGGVRPLAPIDARASRQADGSIVITWKRRTRLRTSLVGPSGIVAPEDDTPMLFKVELYANSARTTLLRTLESSSSSVTYDRSFVVGDALRYESQTIWARIYQVSPYGINGRALDAALMPRLSNISFGPDFSVVGFFPAFLEFGGELLCFSDFGQDPTTTQGVLSSADDGITWDIKRGYPPSWSTYGLPNFVATDARIIAISQDLQYSSIDSRFDQYNYTAWSDDPTDAPTIASPAPKVGGSGQFIVYQASGIDAGASPQEFLLVGRPQNVTAPSGSGLFLHRSSDGLTWVSDGEMAADPSDPNAITYIYGKFWNYSIEASFSQRCPTKLINRSGRWFLEHLFSHFYTDDSTALTGWKRCKTNLGEGASFEYTTGLSSIVEFDGKLVTCTDSAISYSADNGSTWTTFVPTAMSGSDTIEDLYACHGELVILLDAGRALKYSSLPSTGAAYQIVGIPLDSSGENTTFLNGIGWVSSSVVVRRVSLLANGGDPCGLFYSTDSVTWHPVTVNQ